MRIVIDTNIWISGLLWKGDPWQLLRLAESGQIEICIAYPMLLELEEVLGYPRFQPRLKTLNTTASQLATFAFTLATPIDVSPRQSQIVLQDVDDDIFLHCAHDAQADYLVTNDRHLLAFRVYRGVQIVRVEDFLAQVFPKSD